MRKLMLLLAIMLLSSVILAQGQAGDGQRDGVALTIYNEGTALVQDRRTFNLTNGTNVINFTDVASGIDATSVTFRSLTDPFGTRVLEQNYVFDLVDSSALLQRYLDQTITVIATDGTQYSGQLLSGRSGEIILRQDDGQVIVVSLTNVRDLRFPDLPGGLITRPTLRWLIDSTTGGEQQLQLTYLTSGMNWTADYNFLLASDEQALDVNGWVTLTNYSGTSYTDALVKLIAGDVNRIEPIAAPYPGPSPTPTALPITGGGGGVVQREFSEYQLYEIAHPVTVGANETKQVEFITGAGIPAHTFYVYESSYRFYGTMMADQSYGSRGITDVQTYLEFTTEADGGLGADLPAGRVRVYQEDVDGAALLIGENVIDHTPMGEAVQIYLGNAFDLVGERVQTNYNRISQTVLEETYELHLRNRKDEGSVEIRVPEHLFRWSNWTITGSTHPYTQTDANTIEYRVAVPAQGETVIAYTVRYTFPQ
ncbi:MAG: DUF4139 domain-containing protein [Chloroflexi bacterium]|nr:DUF4139 domain-containing protein [Chloroflexota bacterium]